MNELLDFIVCSPCDSGNPTEPSKSPAAACFEMYRKVYKKLAPLLPSQQQRQPAASSSRPLPESVQSDPAQHTRSWPPSWCTARTVAGLISVPHGYASERKLCASRARSEQQARPSRGRHDRTHTKMNIDNQNPPFLRSFWSGTRRSQQSSNAPCWASKGPTARRRPANGLDFDSRTRPQRTTTVITRTTLRNGAVQYK